MKNYILYGATAAVVMGALPATGAAQICAGFPTAPGQAAVALAGTFPREADQFGAEASLNLTGPLAVFGSFTRTTGRGEATEHANTFTAGAALEVSEGFTGAFPLGLSACPTASVAYTDLEGADVWRVPLGVGFGSQIALGPPGTLELIPYIVPQLVWTRVEFERDAAGNLISELFGAPEPEDAERTDIGLRGGLVLGAGRFYFGGEVTDIFRDEVSPVLGVKAGIRF